MVSEVWIVILGFDYEGDDVVGVYSTHARAVYAALAEMSSDPWCVDGPDHWRTGSRYVKVVRREVKS